MSFPKIASILAACGAASSAYAAGGGEHAAGGLFSLDMAAKVVNFLILLALLHLLAKKPLARMMRNVAEAKREQFLEQQKAVDEAEANLARFKAKIEAQEAELIEHKKHALAAIEAEKNRIIEDAKSQAEHMEKNAQMRIDQALQRAKGELRAFLAEESARLAESQLKDKIGPKEQEALMSRYAADFPSKS